MNTKAGSYLDFDNAYFIGIGGIGMSALARYFNELGWRVGGYDKVSSPLTQNLENEGINIHYEDLGARILSINNLTKRSLIIYTPAIPNEMKEFQSLRDSEFHVYKRAEVLGMITRNTTSLAVAGTHGKTTTSSMLANILSGSKEKCNAFLGGIATNFDSNYVGHKMAKYTVVEADEYDRSFLNLNPFAAIVTSTDEDHLDIYSDRNSFHDGFQQFVNQIEEEGVLIVQADVSLDYANKLTYAVESKADFEANKLRFINGKFLFDVRLPKGEWKNVELGMPGRHNAENALACIALCSYLGIPEEAIRFGLSSFEGVKRRFEYQYKSEDLIYIDDYAHHPTELKALIFSVKMLFPDKKIIGVFQPHLYSRTSDFMDEFARELDELDELMLMPIYPAREQPIEGVTSEALLEKVSMANKAVITSEDIISKMSNVKSGVVLTIGAGDIDRLVPQLKNIFEIR